MFGFVMFFGKMIGLIAARFRSARRAETARGQLEQEVLRRKAAEREVENLTSRNERLRLEILEDRPTVEMVLELDRLRAECAANTERINALVAQSEKDLSTFRAALAESLDGWESIAVFGDEKATIARWRALLSPPVETPPAAAAAPTTEVLCVECGKPTDPADRCPKCGSHVMRQYGLAGGGLGPYTICANGDCPYFLKQGAVSAEDEEPVKA